jgi:hypothetical protein
MLSIGATFLGFFLTLIVWNRLMQWGYSVWAAYHADDPQSKSSLALPTLVFANSAPWLLVAYTAFCYFIFGHPHRQEWLWFWAGAAAVPPVIGLIFFSVFRRHKKAKATSGVSTAK